MSLIADTRRMPMKPTIPISDAGLAETILGDSPVMRDLRRLIAKVAPKKLPVLIHGPTGSGKELVAQALHTASRRSGRFVPFNVCAVSEAMFEDALFGHVRGAFTGAISDTQGYMKEADGGTLFLDEISGLGVVQQAKLLRAIETRMFRPVGAGTDGRSDFRVVAATNEDLARRVEEGRFRADLLHRLDGITIRVPPLLERREDIPLLVHHFLEVLAPGQQLQAEPGAVRCLQEYDWPGNIRELRNVVERALLLADRAVLGREDFRRVMPSGAGPEASRSDDPVRRRLLDVLEGCDWNISRAASELQVHWTTVYRWMRELGIRRPRGIEATAPVCEREDPLLQWACGREPV